MQLVYLVMLLRKEFDVNRIRADRDYLQLFNNCIVGNQYISGDDEWVGITIDEISVTMSIGSVLFQVYDDITDSRIRVFVCDKFIKVDAFGTYSYINELVGVELSREIWRLYNKHVCGVVEQISINMELNCCMLTDD